MGGVESTSGTVVRNGDWEHRICWSESKPSINSLNSQSHSPNVSPKQSNQSSLRKSKSDSKNLHKTNERIPQSMIYNQIFSIADKEFEDRLENKDDSDYWSTPSSSIRYRKNEMEDDAHALSFEENHFQRTSSAQKFRRSFQKYTGTVIRSPLDRINGVNPPRRLLRNNFIDGCDNTKSCINTSDMIELSSIVDETKSMDTCSTTTNVSIKDASFGVLI